MIERVPSAYPAKTPGRDAGLDARITTGPNLPEATLEARLRATNRCSRRKPTSRTRPAIPLSENGERKPVHTDALVLLVPVHSDHVVAALAGSAVEAEAIPIEPEVGCLPRPLAPRRRGVAFGRHAIARSNLHVTSTAIARQRESDPRIGTGRGRSTRVAGSSPSQVVERGGSARFVRGDYVVHHITGSTLCVRNPPAAVSSG